MGFATVLSAVGAAPPMSSKSLTGSQLRKFRSEVAALKARGLTSKRVDARSQKPTRYMLGQVAKFKPVLEGRAQVITTKKAGGKSAIENARQYENVLARKGRHLVVPIAKGETARFDAKTGTVKKYGKAPNGQRYSSDITPAMGSTSRTFPQGPNIRYRIPLGNHGSITFDSLQDLLDTLFEYENKKKNPYKDIASYVQVIRLRPGEVDGDEGDE